MTDKHIEDISDIVWHTFIFPVHSALIQTKQEVRNMKKWHSKMKAGERVAYIAYNLAMAGEERPQLRSDDLQRISDEAFELALDDWAEANDV